SAHSDMAVADMKGLKCGSLRLAGVTTAKNFAPRLLGPACQRYSGAAASPKASHRERGLGRMHDTKYALYTRGQPLEHLVGVAAPFLDTPLVVLAPAGLPRAGKNRIPLARRAKEPFLLREPGSGTRAACERLFAEHGMSLKVRMVLGSNEAIKQAI